MNTKPRQQHYLFAHHLLRSAFFRDPSEAVRGLESQGTDWLLPLWERAASLNHSGCLEEQPPEGLDYEIRDLPDGTMVALITLPPADALTEAYFVALVWKPYVLHPQPSGTIMSRYITLEYGVDLAYCSPRPVLAEWTTARTHLNLGTGPEPDLEQFWMAVLELLYQQQPMA